MFTNLTYLAIFQRIFNFYIYYSYAMVYDCTLTSLIYCNVAETQLKFKKVSVYKIELYLSAQTAQNQIDNLSFIKIFNKHLFISHYL